MHSLYHWTHADAVAHDPLLQHKARLPQRDILSHLERRSTSSSGQGWLAIFFWRQSASQDSLCHDVATTKRLQTLSAPGMVLFGVTLTFAAFDWLMSLEPHWFSTIFGVYIFAGCVVAIFAHADPVGIAAQGFSGAMTQVVTWEHFHDMGKLLFGFVGLLGLHRFLPIHADLVRQHPRGDLLVRYALG